MKVGFTGPATLVVTAMVLAAVSPRTGLRADVILMKDDVVYDGQIISEDGLSISIRTRSGVRKLPRSGVREVLYEYATNEERLEAVKTLTASADRIDETLARIMTLAEQQELRERRVARDSARQAGRETEANRTEWVYDPGSFQFGPAWRSALVPGWGQYYKESGTRAGVFGGGFLLSVALLYVTDRQVRSADRDYREAVHRLSLLAPFAVSPALTAFAFVEQEDQFVRRLNASRNRQNVSYLLGIIYVWNIIDAGLVGGGSMSDTAAGDGDDAWRTTLRTDFDPFVSESRHLLEFRFGF